MYVENEQVSMLSSLPGNFRLQAVLLNSGKLYRIHVNLNIGEECYKNPNFLQDIIACFIGSISCKANHLKFVVIRFIDRYV